MANGWQVLDLSKAEVRLRYERGRCVIEKSDMQIGNTPLESLAIIIASPKVTFSGGALSAFTERDVSVVLTDWKGVPVGGAYAWADTTRVGARQRAQGALTVPRSKNAWGRIVTAKILGQAHTLKQLNRDGWRELTSIAKDVRSGDPNNKEALAARMYWRRLFHDQDFLRRPGNVDPTNAMLNCAYTILRGHCMRSVIAAGLHPAFGVMHHGRSNQFALVDDIIEPFRPAIDFFVASYDDRGTVDNDSEIEPYHNSMSPETRRYLVDVSRYGFGNGQRITTELDRFARHFAQYVEGDVERLAVPVWSGPDKNELVDSDDGG